MGAPACSTLGSEAEHFAAQMPISLATPLILGSGSPRRREILAGLGLELLVRPADVSERVEHGESPSGYLARVVREKLAAVASSLDSIPYAGVLVADTIVVIDDEILGKPDSETDAARLVGRLVGRTHEVLTRYAISAAPNPREVVCSRTVSSWVSMRAAEAAEIQGYARTGEGLDKAGAYAVQGIGSFLVERIEGSYSNVIGLPACEVILDLETAGLLERFP